MTLDGIINNVLQNTQWATDAQTQDELKDIIIPLVNDGYREVCERWRPFEVEAVELEQDNTFDMRKLKKNIRRLLKVFDFDSDHELLVTTPTSKTVVKVHNARSARVRVMYEYMPDYLRSDAQTPIIPEAYHSLLVDYAVYGYLMTGDINAQTKSQLWKRKFDYGLSKIRPEFDIPEERKLKNLFMV